jgi:hypothetical protein
VTVVPPLPLGVSGASWAVLVFVQHAVTAAIAARCSLHHGEPAEHSGGCDEQVLLQRQGKLYDSTSRYKTHTHTHTRTRTRKRTRTRTPTRTPTRRRRRADTHKHTHAHTHSHSHAILAYRHTFCESKRSPNRCRRQPSCVMNEQCYPGKDEQPRLLSYATEAPRSPPLPIARSMCNLRSMR